MKPMIDPTISTMAVVRATFATRLLLTHKVWQRAAQFGPRAIG